VTVVTEVQVWVLIGLFATLGTGLVALVPRTIDARFDALSTTMSARFDTVDVRFDAVDRRIDGLDRRIDGLDRDVHMLVNRAVGGEPA
jgi:hypothetical protein